MEWDPKVKKLPNFFNAIIYVGLQVSGLYSSVKEGAEQARAIVTAIDRMDSGVTSLNTSLQSLTQQLSSIEGKFQVFNKVSGLQIIDEYGNEKEPPHSLGELVALLSVKLDVSHEKVDALVDRLGNQFQNEVLAVLKSENAKLEVDLRALIRNVEELSAENKELKKLVEVVEDGDSERDQVEPVQES